MREDNFSKVLEIFRLSLYFITIICALFIGFYLSAIHYQNELLKQDEFILDLYIEMEEYEKANVICYQIQDYIGFIALYGVPFFDIEININELNKKCNAIAWKLISPNENFTIDPSVYTQIGDGR